MSPPRPADPRRSGPGPAVADVAPPPWPCDRRRPRPECSIPERWADDPPVGASPVRRRARPLRGRPPWGGRPSATGRRGGPSRRHPDDIVAAAVAMGHEDGPVRGPGHRRAGIGRSSGRVVPDRVWPGPGRGRSRRAVDAGTEAWHRFHPEQCEAAQQSGPVRPTTSGRQPGRRRWCAPRRRSPPPGSQSPTRAATPMARWGPSGSASSGWRSISMGTRAPSGSTKSRTTSSPVRASAGQCRRATRSPGR